MTSDDMLEPPEQRVREFLDMYEAQYGDGSIIASTYVGGDARNRGVSLETTDVRDMLNENAALRAELEQARVGRNPARG